MLSAKLRVALKRVRQQLHIRERFRQFTKQSAGHEHSKIIKLVVGEKYKVPDLLTQEDPTVNEEVLNLGYTMYNQKQLMLLNATNTSLAKQLEKDYNIKVMQLAESHSTEVRKLTANNEALNMSMNSLRGKLALTSEDLISLGFQTASKEYTTRFDEMKQHFSIQISEKESRHKEMMNELRRQHEESDKKHGEMKEALNNRIKELQESLLTSQHTVSVVEELGQRLQRLMGSSNSVGQLGEIKLDEFIRDKFSSCQLVQTANQKVSGDHTMILEPMHLLIESKNVANMHRSEITKFWRDLEEMVLRKEVNAALFVSWRDTLLFDGKKHFVLHYRMGVPVILISNAQANPELIRISILMLLSLVENGMTIRDGDGIDSMDEKSKYVLSLVEHLYVDYLEYSATLKEERKALSVMADQLKKREAVFSRMAQRFDEAIKRFPDIKHQSSGKEINIGKPTLNTQNIDDLVEKIRDHNRDHPGSRVTEDKMVEWGYDRSFLKNNGGVRSILNMARVVNADEKVGYDEN